MNIVREDGQRGKITKRKPRKGLPAELSLEFEDGSRLVITEDQLQKIDDKTSLLHHGASVTSHLQRVELEHGGELVIPVTVEELVIEKRKVETGKVRINTRVEKREEVVDEPLLHQEISVERVAIDREIHGEVPTPREEGNVLVIPIIEEVLVVTKQLRLKEELRVTRHNSKVHKPQRLEVRHEVVEILRLAGTGTVTESSAALISPDTRAKSASAEKPARAKSEAKSKQTAAKPKKKSKKEK